MKHKDIEKNIGLMLVLAAIAVSFGGLAELVPLIASGEVSEPYPGIEPYDAVALAGRDVYIREGCNNCHSQQIRPFRWETQRYGHYSVAGESVYDHPFLWGSKRTGPDLARVGGRYTDEWHRVHLIDPRTVVPESNMPAYPWLLDDTIDGADMQDRMRALRMIGVPYTDADIEGAPAMVEGTSEMDALIYYLQGLGLAIRENR
jgi:cytochrome c oxidase cbb3-type subunit 2